MLKNLNTLVKSILLGIDNNNEHPKYGASSQKGITHAAL